jgi:hypothetical protein
MAVGNTNRSFRELSVYKRAFELAMSEEVGRMLNHMVENPERYMREKDKISG